MVALAVYASIFSSIIYLITSALNTRDRTNKYNHTIFLAKQKMDTVRGTKKAASGEGDFSAFPDYNYTYTIIEEEIDLLGLADKAGFLQTLDPDQQERLEKKINKLLGSGQRKESVSAGIFKVWHYSVRVQYLKDLSYTLDFYRRIK